MEKLFDCENGELDITIVSLFRNIIVRSPRRGGFTLIEAALATVIIGMGVVATLGLFGTCAESNAASNNQTVGMMLAGNIQELAASMQFNDPYYGRTTFGSETGETVATYNDIDDLDGKTFNPPIDAERNTLENMSQYSQVISVWPVYTTKLSSNTNTTTPDIAKTTYTGAARVTVQILYKARPTDTAKVIYTTDWIRLDR